jgi:hypothetical protein
LLLSEGCASHRVGDRDVANTLTDLDTFYIDIKEIQTLIRPLETLRKPGVHLARVVKEVAPTLTESLETATTETGTTLSADLAISHSSGHVSVQGTSPFLSRWKNPNPELEPSTTHLLHDPALLWVPLVL